MEKKLSKDNKLIFKNTIIIYMRMIIVTIVGLISSRFVLRALGISDYGLYNIVAGLIAMLNFISTAMSTTTRRFVNVEMGKVDGNLNKVFNVSLLLHLGFAFFILFIAETLGLWYINNLLNVEAGKLADAKFVFQISTIVACIGIINVPCQSLIEAFERFAYTAIIDIVITFIKLVFVILLVSYSGNTLRLYSILMCLISLISFIMYYSVCYLNWKEIIKFKLYKKCTMYRDILVFNNYTAMGAAASIGKAQGGNLLVNFFFGTVINGAFAIAFQVETYIYMFVNKLTLASNPQIAKNYSEGILDRSNRILEKNTKYSILIMLIFYFTLIFDLDYILHIWLGQVPKEATLLCFLTLTDALVRSFSEGTNGYIQASGKIKWFQILTSLTLLINIPLAYILFSLGYDAFWILICYIFSDILYRICSLWMMRKILGFDVFTFIIKAFVPPIKCIILMIVVIYFLRLLPICTFIQHFGMIFLTGLLSIICVFFVGLDYSERNIFYSIFKKIE